jgi:hypothetical protein
LNNTFDALTRVVHQVWQFDFWKLATIGTALFVACVGYQQYRLGRERFKLDLFEKRFAVFAGARLFLKRILEAGAASLEHIYTFRASRAETIFLFDSDIADYFDDIDRKAVRLWSLQEKIKSLAGGDERTAIANEIMLVIAWLVDQLPQLPIRFAPYLKFRTWI